MKKVAMFFYKKICILGIPVFRREQVDADLAQLHPGERLEYIKTEYYVKKLSLFLMVIFLGAFLGFAVKISAKNSAALDGNGAIIRGNYTEGEKELLLTADDGESKRTFQVAVQPQTLTRAELEQLFREFFKYIGDYILNGNTDLKQISSDLLLTETYEGFPFEVRWESSRPEVVDESGTVGEVENKCGLELKATLSYGDFGKEGVVEIVVVPPERTAEEKTYLELEKYLLETEADTRENERWILPEKWRGKSLQWTRQITDFSFVIWAITPTLGALIYMMADQDLHKELENRRKLLSREYPELVHKLLLYVGAGMTIRGAFKKIAGDYENDKKEKRRPKPGSEEVLYTCRELQAGVSEGAAYEHFGRRAGVREYIRLGTLLGQNLKRGNNTLLERLREEAEKATAENLLQVRKLGEEAGTKLLLPMVMMLAIIMVIIMIPAFGTM